MGLTIRKATGYWYWARWLFFQSKQVSETAQLSCKIDYTRKPSPTSRNYGHNSIFSHLRSTMINIKIFVPWDLTFGSGIQTLGSLLTVITVGWVIKRANTLKELGLESNIWLYYWLKFVIPIAILAVGTWWVLTDLLGVFAQ